MFNRFVLSTGNLIGCSESEPWNPIGPQPFGTNDGRPRKWPSSSTRAKASIVGEALDICSQQLFQGRKDNMSRVSCDESSEPLKGRKCSPILAKVVEQVRADDCFAIVSAYELNDHAFKWGGWGRQAPKKARTSGAVLLEIKTLRRMNGCCSGFMPESQQISSTWNRSMYAGEA